MRRMLAVLLFALSAELPAQESPDRVFAGARLQALGPETMKSFRFDYLRQAGLRTWELAGELSRGGELTLRSIELGAAQRVGSRWFVSPSVRLGSMRTLAEAETFGELAAAASARVSARWHVDAELARISLDGSSGEVVKAGTSWSRNLVGLRMQLASGSAGLAGEHTALVRGDLLRPRMRYFGGAVAGESSIDPRFPGLSIPTETGRIAEVFFGVSVFLDRADVVVSLSTGRYRSSRRSELSVSVGLPVSSPGER